MQAFSLSENKPIPWPLILLLILAMSVIFAVIADQVAASGDDLVNGDFFTFWLAGRMIASGENPYDPAGWVENHTRFGASWVPNPTFIYPLPLAVLMAPLGGLELGTASRLWIFLSLWMVLTSGAMLLHHALGDFRLVLWVPVFAGIFTFRATLVTLRNGQLGAFFLMVLVFVILLWSRERWILGGLLLPLLALKPSFGIPLLALIGCWLMLNRRWNAVIALLVSLIGLAVVGWLVDMNWISRFLSAGQVKFSANLSAFPNLLGWSYSMFSGDLPLALSFAGAVSTVLIAALAVYLWSRRQRLQPADAISLLVPAALLLSPYLWAYDQVLLLIPIVITAGYLARRGMPYWLPAALPLLFSLGSLLLIWLALQKGDDSWSSMCSVVSLCCFLLVVERGYPPPAKVRN